jgi:hypothetical protein
MKILMPMWLINLAYIGSECVYSPSSRVTSGIVFRASALLRELSLALTRRALRCRCIHTKRFPVVSLIFLGPSALRLVLYVVTHQALSCSQSHYPVLAPHSVQAVPFPDFIREDGAYTHSLCLGCQPRGQQGCHGSSIFDLCLPIQFRALVWNRLLSHVSDAGPKV